MPKLTHIYRLTKKTRWWFSQQPLTQIQTNLVFLTMTNGSRKLTVESITIWWRLIILFLQLWVRVTASFGHRWHLQERKDQTLASAKDKMHFHGVTREMILFPGEGACVSWVPLHDYLLQAQQRQIVFLNIFATTSERATLKQF